MRERGSEGTLAPRAMCRMSSFLGTRSNAGASILTVGFWAKKESPEGLSVLEWR
jgi:hypothetical protein